MEKMLFCMRCGFLLWVCMPPQCAYYESLISLWVTGLAGERSREKREEGGGSTLSPFALQERSQRGAEGMQSLAQPAWRDTAFNMLISPLISTWKYLVLGGECEKPKIMSVCTPHLYHSARLCWLCCSNSLLSAKDTCNQCLLVPTGV